MLDIHTHILPGMDDGSKSVECSISLLREEAAQGVGEVVLTPHFYADQNSVAQFLERREKAWSCLLPRITEGMPRLRLGAEVQYFEGICGADGLEQLKIQGSGILLLEMPFCKWTERMIRDVLELNSRYGMQVLLAHVERYLSFQDKKTMARLVEAGVLCQSNLSFFNRWQTRHRAISMLNRDMIHVLGSDCHSLEHRAPGWDALPKTLRQSAEDLNRCFASEYLSRETVL